MITQKDYKIIVARCTYNDKGNHDIEYVVIEYQGKLYIGQSNKSQHEALNNAVKSIDKDKLLELYRKHMTTLCKNTREGVKDSMFSAEYVAYEVYQQIKSIEEELK